MVLEYNIDMLSKLLPEFAKDPLGFYEKNKDLQPEIK